MQMPKQICVRINKQGWCWSGAFTMQVVPRHAPPRKQNLHALTPLQKHTEPHQDRIGTDHQSSGAPVAPLDPVAPVRKHEHIGSTLG